MGLGEEAEGGERRAGKMSQMSQMSQNGRKLRKGRLWLWKEWLNGYMVIWLIWF